MILCCLIPILWILNCNLSIHPFIMRLELIPGDFLQETGKHWASCQSITGLSAISVCQNKNKKVDNKIIWERWWTRQKGSCRISFNCKTRSTNWKVKWKLDEHRSSLYTYRHGEIHFSALQHPPCHYFLTQPWFGHLSSPAP